MPTQPSQTKPSQPTSNELRAGLLGWPISHSLSPRLHGFWLQHYHISGEYTALPVAPDVLREIVKKLVDDGWKGFNLTIPHKEAILPFLDAIDPVAERIGAVNTVVISAGKLMGRNTDSYGFWENIRPSIAHKRKAVILGAGGAARAVVEALDDAGFEQICIANRNLERAKILVGARAHITAVDWEHREAALRDADLLVNTTSLGMTGKEALSIDLALLPTSALVHDIVYSPLMTPLLLQAQIRGNPVVGGLGMLLHQAVPAFEAWFGKRPEVTPELRRYVLGG